MKLEKNIIVREIAGEYILIPTGEAALKMTGIFAVTEVGAEIWKRLSQGKDEDTVIAELLAEYEVGEATLRQDYAEFIGRLVDSGLAEL
ncbi:MAG: PqqD family protein [Clostridia bacterium]|nr:PqqD family protein [Clostridia bacterium]